MATKRRRLSEDGHTSPTTTPDHTNTATRPPLMRNYMTPTKASVAKSHPHLAKPLTSSLKGTSPTRPQHRLHSPPRRSIPPDPPTEVIGARSFLDIANAPDDNDPKPLEEEEEEEPTRMAVSVRRERGRGLVETHLSSEEEIERLRNALMRRIRLLRAECEGLEGQVEGARQAMQKTMQTQELAVQTNLPATMYPWASIELTDHSESLLRSNDSSISRQQEAIEESETPSLPTAAPKNLKNPVPLLRFVHPLTFYSTISHLVPMDDQVQRQYELKGYTLDRELYFSIAMSVNENQEQITALKIHTSPWANLELSPFLNRYPHNPPYRGRS
jgi:hypothetical protein